MNIFSTVPIETWYKIISYMDYDSILGLSNTCQTVNKMNLLEEHCRPFKNVKELVDDKPIDLDYRKYSNLKKLTISNFPLNNKYTQNNINIKCEDIAVDYAIDESEAINF